MSSLKRFFRRATGTAQLVAHLDALTVELKALQQRLTELEAEAYTPPHTADGKSLVMGTGDSARFGYDQTTQGTGDSAYADFEDVFRGDEGFIRSRLSGYLSLLPPSARVVDLGCGRGEMLDLLAGAGHSGVGVDLDPGMVERCHRNGHDVTQADAVQYLNGLAPGSVDAVFSAQFIEHIDPAGLPALLLAARKALKADGAFIAETVNPHSLSALRTFWVDLSHWKPLFPESVLLMCLSAGFTRAHVVFPNGTGSFEHDRRHTGEYAVIARP